MKDSKTPVHKHLTTKDPRLGEQDILVAGDKVEVSPKEPVPEKLLRELFNALNRSYRNNQGEYVKNHELTIKQLRGPVEAVLAYDYQHLSLRFRKKIAEAFNDLGVALGEKARVDGYLGLGLLEENLYLKALQIAPKQTMSYINLGRFYKRLGEAVKLQALVDKAEFVFGGHPLLKELLGMRT